MPSGNRFEGFDGPVVQAGARIVCADFDCVPLSQEGRFGGFLTVGLVPSTIRVGVP